MRAKELKEYIFENDKVIDILELIGMQYINTLNSNYITCGMPETVEGERHNSTIVYHNDDYLGVTAYTRNIKPEGWTSQADIINLTAYVLKMEYSSAKNYLASYLGLSTEGGSIKTKDNISFFRKAIKKTKKANNSKEQVYYDESILEGYSRIPHIDLIRKDGLISQYVLDKYHVMFDYRSDRILFPHYKWDDATKICGISGRTVNPAYKELNINKYVSMLSTEYKKTQNLYALCWNMEYIKSIKKVIVFEAEKSCMKIDLFKLPPIGVAVGCHDISDVQKKILLSLDCEEIIIAFDKDVDEEHLINTCKMFSKYVKVSYIFDKWNLLKDKDSPVDKGIKIWKFLYEHRIEYKES